MERSGQRDLPLDSGMSPCYVTPRPRVEKNEDNDTRWRHGVKRLFCEIAIGCYIEAIVR
jgi:hypothetical protein